MKPDAISMSNRAASFVEEWVRENAVKPVEGRAGG
jgi:hypothetical protein